MLSLKKLAGVVLFAALLTPAVATASACLACRGGCDAAYPDQYSDEFLQCFANCYDENGIACQRDI